jgi:hypothetical protein
MAPQYRDRRWSDMSSPSHVLWDDASVRSPRSRGNVSIPVTAQWGKVHGMSRHEFADIYPGLGSEFSAEACLAESSTVVPLLDGGDDGVGVFGPMEGARVVVGLGEETL